MPSAWATEPSLPSFDAELIQGGGSAAVSLAAVHTQVAPEVLAHLLLSYGFRFHVPEAPLKFSMPVDHVENQDKLLLPNVAPRGLRKISDETAKRVQTALRLALVGMTPEKIFAKFDKDKDGLLSADEFRRLVRMNLRIPADKLSDADVAAFVTALDDDGSGTLGVAEVLDFVERGTATFFSGPEDHVGPVQPSLPEPHSPRDKSSSTITESRPSAIGFSRQSPSGQGSPNSAVSPGQRAAKQRIARSVRARRPASAPGFALRPLLVEVASRSVTPVPVGALAPARPSSRASARSMPLPAKARPLSSAGSPSPYAPQGACQGQRSSTGSRPRPARPQSSTGFANFQRGALDKMLFGQDGDGRKQWES